MADEVSNYNTPAAGARERFIAMRQISWAAIFSGALVALAVEVLFLSFGFFVGFRLSGTGASIWGAIWYWIGCFCSLLAGGWVAARLGANPEHGKVHGLVTWGLATVATFGFLTFMSWGVLNQSLGLVRTAALAASSAAPTASRMAPGEAERIQNETTAAVNQAQQQAPHIAQAVARDISMLSLVLWIGFMVAAFGSLVGGAMGAKHIVLSELRP